MCNRAHRITLKGASLTNSATCVVSLLMLLAFPMSPAGHQFTGHFRTPEVCRSIERCTSIAHPEAGTAERIARQAALPTLLVPIDTGDADAPVVNIEFAPQTPLSRMLLRLKPGSSRSGGPDPLL